MSVEAFKKFYKEEKNVLKKAMNHFNNKLLREENLLIRENLELFTNLNSDGKLIRGCLVNLGYYLLKNDREYSNSLALAYEIFQTSILVHDDVIDRDNARRGKDTIHYSNYKKYYDYYTNKGELLNLSNSIAICMGDYGLYSANKIISDSYCNDKNLAKLLICFNNTILNTIKGELLDVILPSQSKIKKLDNKTLMDNIMNVYLLKTAHYTIIGPLSVGLILAGAADEKLKEIEEFAEKVGIAFQIQDDILGIFSNETGKVIGSDIKEFKQTILYAYISNTKYKNELLKYYGKDKLDNNILSKVRELFEISGALEYSINTMNKYYDDAIKILDNITWIDLEKKMILQGFVDYLRERNR